MLKPVDVIVLAGLLAEAEATWGQVDLARTLGISQSNVHRSLKQLERSGLIRGKRARPVAVTALFEHAIGLVYPPIFGPPSRGVPTAHSGPGSAGILANETYVWPHDEGSAYGVSLEPLHKSVPAASLHNPRFHQIASLVELFRVGRVRERALAMERLTTILEAHESRPH